jgi:hypothetical protein
MKTSILRNYHCHCPPLNWEKVTLQLAGHDSILENLMYFLSLSSNSKLQFVEYKWDFEKSRPFSTCCLQVHYMSRERLARVGQDLKGCWEIKLDMDLYLLNWIHHLEVKEIDYISNGGELWIRSKFRIIQYSLRFPIRSRFGQGLSQTLEI